MKPVIKQYAASGMLDWSGLTSFHSDRCKHDAIGFPPPVPIRAWGLEFPSVELSPFSPIPLKGSSWKILQRRVMIFKQRRHDPLGLITDDNSNSVRIVTLTLPLRWLVNSISPFDSKSSSVGYRKGKFQASSKMMSCYLLELHGLLDWRCDKRHGRLQCQNLWIPQLRKRYETFWLDVMQYFNQDDQTLTVCLSALPQYSRDFHKPCVIGSRKYAKKGFEKSQKFRSKIWSLNDKIYALWESQLKKFSCSWPFWDGHSMYLYLLIETVMRTPCQRNFIDIIPTIYFHVLILTCIDCIDNCLIDFNVRCFSQDVKSSSWVKEGFNVHLVCFLKGPCNQSVRKQALSSSALNLM